VLYQGDGTGVIQHIANFNGIGAGTEARDRYRGSGLWCGKGSAVYSVFKAIYQIKIFHLKGDGTVGCTITEQVGKVCNGRIKGMSVLYVHVYGQGSGTHFRDLESFNIVNGNIVSAGYRRIRPDDNIQIGVSPGIQGNGIILPIVCSVIFGNITGGSIRDYGT